MNLRIFIFRSKNNNKPQRNVNFFWLLGVRHKFIPLETEERIMSWLGQVSFIVQIDHYMSPGKTTEFSGGSNC